MTLWQQVEYSLHMARCSHSEFDHLKICMFHWGWEGVGRGQRMHVSGSMLWPHSNLAITKLEHVAHCHFENSHFCFVQDVSSPNRRPAALIAYKGFMSILRCWTCCLLMTCAFLPFPSPSYFFLPFYFSPPRSLTCLSTLGLLQHQTSDLS